ncbi:hypothetical protein MES5069_530032 [Mesorhizobium escarrei]|uniref:Uncharacterized protein n=1 Tax=Mesorhizobium escarrei TaxID=666018 RepID=A0ABN8KBX6_9HYPH|nr:hypothetical protein MES5069_530032 [Mesorhizobium escarrei]
MRDVNRYPDFKAVASGKGASKSYWPPSTLALPLIRLPAPFPRIVTGRRGWPQRRRPFCNAGDWRNPLRRRPSPRHYTGRNARQGNEGQRRTEAIARVFSLFCDGSCARNLFMVLVCANDPPDEAGFCFRHRRRSPFAVVDGHWANA